jgi:digeranylgeranylglycerophospholipid reductase
MIKIFSFKLKRKALHYRIKEMLNESGIESEAFSVNAFAKQTDLVDVIVIGAGPAGSVTAGEIAKSGFNVLLIEKDDFPGQTNVCAGGIEKWVVDDFELGDIVEKEISRSKYHFPWGVEEYDADAATVKREVFDKFLACKAEAAGVKLLTNMVALDVIRDEDYLKVNIKDRRKAVGEVVKTRLVVFADGPNTLAKKFGIGFEIRPDTVAESSIFEIEWKNNPMSTFEFFFFPDISPWGYGWMFPKRDTINIGVYSLYMRLERNIYDYLRYFFSEICSKEWKGKKREIIRFTSALIPLVPAKQIHEERMLVVGDAAGMVDPFFGGGISHAIRSGRIAGGVALNALEEGNFTKEFFSKYQKEWERTEDYISIEKMYHLSNVFLSLSKVDKNIFGKMISIGLNKRGMMRKLLYRTNFRKV